MFSSFNFLWSWYGTLEGWPSKRPVFKVLFALMFYLLCMCLSVGLLWEVCVVILKEKMLFQNFIVSRPLLLDPWGLCWYENHVWGWGIPACLKRRRNCPRPSNFLETLEIEMWYLNPSWGSLVFCGWFTRGVHHRTCWTWQPCNICIFMLVGDLVWKIIFSVWSINKLASIWSFFFIYNVCR